MVTQGGNGRRAPHLGALCSHRSDGGGTDTPVAMHYRCCLRPLLDVEPKA